MQPTPPRPSTSSGQRRTYTVTGDTLHISDPVLGLAISYSMDDIYAMIDECEAELGKLQGYRRRILGSTSSPTDKPAPDGSSASPHRLVEGATPCPECAGTGRYGDTNFHCEWCGGTGKAASEQRAGAGEVEP